MTGVQTCALPIYQLLTRKNTSFGQNQGLVWSSDSSLWGNQLLKKKMQVLDRTKALYGHRTQAYGETNCLKEKIQVLDRTKALYGPRTQAYGETSYLKEIIQVLGTTRYNQTSVLGSEARYYRKHGQSSTLLGNPLGWIILGSLFSDTYLTRVTVHSTVISVSLISLICY